MGVAGVVAGLGASNEMTGRPIDFSFGGSGISGGVAVGSGRALGSGATADPGSSEAATPPLGGIAGVSGKGWALRPGPDARAAV